jgi:hypothetical protein
MVDKEQLKTVVEAARESRTHLPDTRCGSDCCCPVIVQYFIMANCLTINNAACPEWDFCEPCIGYSKG